MTDPVRPDSGIPPRDEVLAAVAQATAQVAADITERAEVERRAPRRRAWMTPLAIVLTLTAIASWALVPPEIETDDPRPAARVERDLKIELASLATQVAAWRAEHGALPDSLAQTGAKSETVTYRRLDATTFELQGSEGGRTMSYRSSQPLSDFSAGLDVRPVAP